MLQSGRVGNCRTLAGAAGAAGRADVCPTDGRTLAERLPKFGSARAGMLSPLSADRATVRCAGRNGRAQVVAGVHAAAETRLCAPACFLFRQKIHSAETR